MAYKGARFARLIGPGLLRKGSGGLKQRIKERGQQRVDIAVALRGVLFNASCTKQSLERLLSGTAVSMIKSRIWPS